MAALLQIGLINAVLATLLAGIVALVARKARRPALTHLLWICVLAKLVTPPVFEVPIEVPFPLPAAFSKTTNSTGASNSTGAADSSAASAYWSWAFSSCSSCLREWRMCPPDTWACSPCSGA